MLRTSFIVSMIVFCGWSFASAVEDNAKVDQVMKDFTALSDEAEKDYQAKMQEAAAERAEAVAEGREKAVRDLKRLVNKRGDVAEQAMIYKQVLRLERGDEEAVQFFTAIGTIEQVLADLEPVVETDMLGNPIVPADKASEKTTATKEELPPVDPEHFTKLLTKTSWRVQQGANELVGTYFNANGTWDVNDAAGIRRAGRKVDRANPMASGRWQLKGNTLVIEYSNGRKEEISVEELADGEWRMRLNGMRFSVKK